jgi:hypothetical protein
MATPALVRDFKEFLKSLNSNSVEYLLIGGYAVVIQGDIRAGDLDIDPPGQCGNPGDVAEKSGRNWR